MILLSASLTAQVGINTDNPQALLHVNGSVKLDGKLYLEAPGDYSQIRGSKLLVNTDENTIVQYDIGTSKYGPINYAQLVFKETSTNGLQDYDTKIATSEYLVSIQGYYFTGPNGNTDVMPRDTINGNNIPGFQMYAYKNTETSTWFVRGFFNDATVQSLVAGRYQNTTVDLYLNLIIFRRGFLSKEQNNLTVDVTGSETFTAPLPAGF